MTNTVDIITRTKNRQVMLLRALDSIASQKYQDFTWHIVNDGGQQDIVNSIARVAASKGISVAVHHNEASQGRWVAANIGLNMGQGKYIVIHDDDDSWEPAFLAETVTFLENQPTASTIQGVVTRSMKVTEIVKDDRIETIKNHPYDANLMGVTLFGMAHLRNVPPPISFVYCRQVLNQLRAYDERLPVLGDWEFYLRFLSRFDIGVIPKYLANYHWRETVKEGAYGNSMVADIDVHEQYRAIILNDLLRKDLSTGNLGLGFIVNLAQEFNEVDAKLNPWYKLARALKKPFRGIVKW